MTAADGGLPGPSLSNAQWRGAASRPVSPSPEATLFGILILLAVLPYANTLFNGFVYDDHTQVLNNPYLRSFRYLREIFSTTVWSYIGAQGGSNYYRPMMTFGYLMCYQLFGPLAYGFHLASIVLHAAAVCLVFMVTRRIFQDRGLAFGAAGLFALHPVHTESVAWIAAVTDLELTLFYLLTFWFFLIVPKAGGGRSALAQLGMTASYALAILSKEQSLTLPFLATVYEHFYREDHAETTGPQKVARYGPLWLLLVAYVLFRLRFLGGFAPVLQRPGLDWSAAVLSAFALLGQYAGKLLWPVNLVAFYVFHESRTLLDWRVIAGIGVLAVGGMLFLGLWRHARQASFGLVLFFLTLLPVLNARWMSGNVFAERYLYLPSVGFSMLATWAVARLWGYVSGRSPAGRRGLALALSMLVALCTLSIVTRNRDWHDDQVLYARTLAAQPDSWHIHNNLGTSYWSRGDTKAAEQEWREALRIKPANPLALSNLGLVRAREKRYEEAVQLFQQALKLQPKFVDAHLHLGDVYLETGSRDLAELQFRAAVALAPLSAPARNHLGQLYFASGRTDEAEEQFRRSVENLPTSLALDRLGGIYFRRGARGEAERAFRGALELDAADDFAHFGLGELYAQAGRNAEAVREYEAGLVTNPSDPEALKALDKLKRQTPHANFPKP